MKLPATTLSAHGRISLNFGFQLRPRPGISSATSTSYTRLPTTRHPATGQLRGAILPTSRPSVLLHYSSRSQSQHALQSPSDYTSSLLLFVLSSLPLPRSCIISGNPLSCSASRYQQAFRNKDRYTYTRSSRSFISVGTTPPGAVLRDLTASKCLGAG